MNTLKTSRRSKAQGSLEYLIIIAAVLAIAAIVVLFLTGVLGGGKGQSSVTACKAAASRCANEIATSASTECEYCKDACAAIPTKIPLCKAGKAEDIY